MEDFDFKKILIMVGFVIGVLFVVTLFSSQHSARIGVIVLLFGASGFLLWKVFKK